MKQPEDCNNIDEVRKEIDQIDSQIIDLLALRLDYVKEVVKYKETTKEGIKAQKRYDSVLKKRRQMAEEKGLDPDIIEKVYTELVHYYINEQMKITNLK